MFRYHINGKFPQLEQIDVVGAEPLQAGVERDPHGRAIRRAAAQHEAPVAVAAVDIAMLVDFQPHFRMAQCSGAVPGSAANGAGAVAADAVVIDGPPARFVGRGAMKLEHALDVFGLDVGNKRALDVGGERVSSSAVRAALLEADLGHAARLLGRPYSIAGRVIRGDRIGRQLGFPTANLRFAGKVPALQGIYATRVHGLEGMPGVDAARAAAGWPSVSSFGTRPTVDGVEPLLEAHLFDFAGDLYGRRIEVEFVAKLRDEQKFSDLAALTAQMQRDAVQARALLEQDQQRAFA